MTRPDLRVTLARLVCHDSEVAAVVARTVPARKLLLVLAARWLGLALSPGFPLIWLASRWSAGQARRVWAARNAAVRLKSQTRGRDESDDPTVVVNIADLEDLR